MIIRISGLKEILEGQRLGKRQLEELTLQVVENVADAVYYNWRQNASDKLKSTRRIYLRNLIRPEFQVNGVDVKATIVLTGQLPNMIEDGAGVFDMKQGFKGAKNVKMKKGGGWYTTINFRFASSGALGEDEAFSGKLPKSVHDVAKSLSPDFTDLSKKQKSPGESLKKSAIPKPYDEVKTRSGHGNYGSYTHKNSIYEGMIRQVKTYEKATQSKYITFRRISDKSDPNSWIHPGFKASHFAEKALEDTNVELITEQVVVNFLKSIGR